MDISEFLNREPEQPVDTAIAVEEAEEIDVQKAVVESLAADKAEQDEVIAALQQKDAEQKESLSALTAKNDELQKSTAALQAELSAVRAKMAQMAAELSHIGDLLAKNAEGEASNKIALLDRNAELDDRFEGETRDHVIEVLRAARDEAEKSGRNRRAQILESVLLVNEPNGELARRRTELEKMFADNANIVSGVVLDELKKRGLSHKNGESYLLPSEIVARNF